MAIPTVALSQAQEGSPSDDSAPGPAAFGALATGAASADRESTASERAESQTAHADLTDTAALAIFERTFGEELHAETVPELDLAEGEAVDSYLGAYTATIDIPGQGPDLLAESATQLTASEAGSKAPLDSELVVEGDHLEAENAPLEAELPQSIDQPLEVGAVGIEVGLGRPAEAEEVSDKAVYPNAGADTDIVLSPSAFGAHAAYQLRSVESPEVLVLDFVLPADAELQLADDGSALIVAGDDTKLATIATPLAFDAESTPVEVRYRLNESEARLELEVSHRDRDLLYPLYVDPLIEDYTLASNQNLEMWNFMRYPQEHAGLTHLYEVNGLRANAHADYSYGAYDSAQWNVHSYRDSTIEKLNLNNFDHANGYPPTCLTLGIWSRATAWWEPGQVRDYYGNSVGAPGLAAQELCGPQSNNSRELWVGQGPEIGDTPGTNRNYGVFGIHVPPCCAGYRWVESTALIRRGIVYRYDYEAPTASYQTAPSSAWRDAAATERLTAFAVDEGLGVKRFELHGPTGLDPLTGGSVVSATHPCSGLAGSRCPGYEGWAQGLDFRLPEGRSELTLYADDMISRRSSPVPLTQRIDRSPPSIAVSGPLTAQQGKVLPDGLYALHVDASDGSLASSATRRSGVREISIYVDNDLVHQRQQGCASSCSMSADFTLNTTGLTTGEHLVAVQATDGVGQDAYEVIELTVRRPETEITDGPLAVIGTRSASFSFDSPVSGARFACRLDAQAWASCTSPHTFSGMTDGSHTMKVRAWDDTTGTVDPSPATRPIRVDPSYVEPEDVTIEEGMAANPDPDVLEVYDYVENADFQPQPGLRAGGLPSPDNYNYNVTDKEEAFCFDNDVHKALCVEFLLDAKKAGDLAEHLFTGEARWNDNTRGNAFQHAFWVALMTRSALKFDQDVEDLGDNPKALALAYSLFHEWDDEQDKYRYADHYFPVLIRRASRMDAINDQIGWQITKIDDALTHRDEWHCKRFLLKALRAKHIGPDVDPFKKASERRLIFRKFSDLQDVFVELNGNGCEPA